MLVTTRWFSYEPRIIYQKYGETYNFQIFQHALQEIRRYLWRTSDPVFVIIDYTDVVKLTPFSMMRAGVLMENTRPPNAVLGVAVARQGSKMYRYNAIWLRLGQAIGSKAARDFHLTSTVGNAYQIILQHIAQTRST